MKLVYKNLLLVLALCATTQAMEIKQTIQSPIQNAVFVGGLATIGTSYSNDYKKFFEAAKAGNVSEVKEFIKLGADVNKANGYGETSLSWAACFGHKEVVQLLIQANVNIDKTNFFGQTPLHLAVYGGHKEVVRLLLQVNTDIDKADAYGKTPLCVAAMNGHNEIVELLVACNAIIDQGAIDIARNKGYEQIAKSLEQMLFNIKQLNKNGMRVLCR